MNFSSPSSRIGSAVRSTGPWTPPGSWPPSPPSPGRVRGGARVRTAPPPFPKEAVRHHPVVPRSPALRALFPCFLVNRNLLIWGRRFDRHEKNGSADVCDHRDHGHGHDDRKRQQKIGRAHGCTPLTLE